MKAGIPIRAGGVYDVRIDDLGIHGEGIGKYEGFTLFVPGALPGETVRAEAALIKKGYAVGVLREVLEASPRRAVPDCPVYADCGGCQISHLTYEGQLEAKRKRAAAAVSRIGGYPESLVLPVIPAPHPFGYRNKMAVPAGPGPEGAVLGCYRQGSHDIIPAPSCLIQRDANNRLLAAARAVMKIPHRSVR